MIFKNYLRQPLVRMLFLISLIFLCSICNRLHAQYVHTQGTQLLDENGEELFLSGINLGNWLLWEGYLMMGDFNYRTHTQFLGHLEDAFGSQTRALEFQHQWRLNYVDKQAIADLKGLGFNSVRVPFHYNLFWQNGTLVNDGFVYFDRLIQWCKTYGIYILLDMHAAPGYQNPGDHSDNLDSNASQPRDTVKFWDGETHINIASEVWQHIASRYKNEPTIWGYDLINEPVPQPGREYELLESLIKMRNAIRQVDNNHVIVAEGSWWASDLQKIDWTDPETQMQTAVTSAWDDNLVYQTHHYGPASDTLNRHTITNNMGIPQIIGEFGESDNGNLAQITDWAKRELVGYYPWSFKKMSHDKTLWTIPPNTVYNQFKNFVNSGGAAPRGLYDGMIAFAKTNIKNGHSSHVWHQGFYDAVKPSGGSTPTRPDPTCDDANAVNVPAKLEAEAYCAMTGIQTESTNDTGGGENIGWVDAGDWLEYKVQVETADDYKLSVRLASNVSMGAFDVLVDGQKQADIAVGNTGGWQQWETRSKTVTLARGTRIIRIAFTGEGVNINWINIKKADTSSSSPCQNVTELAVPGTIQAESYCDMRGIQTQGTADIGGGLNIGWIDDGDWTAYRISVASSRSYTLGLRVASPFGGARVQVLAGANQIAVFDVPNTGAWQNWTTINQTVSLPAGKQVLTLKYSPGRLNVNWLGFSVTQSNPSTPVVAGRYALLNNLSKKAIDVANWSTTDGGNVHQWTYEMQANQHWDLVSVAQGVFEIINIHSGLCLDADAGSDNVQQWSCVRNDNQLWSFVKSTDGSLRIKLANQNQYLTVQGDVNQNAANLATSSSGDDAKKHWLIEPVR